MASLKIVFAWIALVGPGFFILKEAQTDITIQILWFCVYDNGR